MGRAGIAADTAKRGASAAAGPRESRAALADRAEKRLAKVERFLLGAYADAVVAARVALSEDEIEALIVDASATQLRKADDRPEIAWNTAASLDLRVLGVPYEVVLVDVALFDAAWREDGAIYVRPGSAQSGPALTEAVARAARAGIMLPPPVVADLDGHGRWAFLNGGNRYLYAREAWHETVPLAVARRDAARLENAAGVGRSASDATGRMPDPAGILSRPYADLNDALTYVGSILAERFFGAVMASAMAVGEQEAVRLATLLARRADARSIAEKLVKLDTALDFETPNYAALAELQLASMSLIVEMTNEQREVILEVLRSGVERGINPREMAREFRASVGLTRSQEEIVERYRQALQRAHLDPLARANARGRALHDNRFNAGLRRAADGEALSAEKIEQMVARYRERWIAYRAEVIARTQALRAVHMAEEAVWQTAVERGDIVAAEVEVEWLTARDNRVRDSHRSMNGQKRKMGVAFASGRGVPLRFPGDPAAPPAETCQCRCTLLRQISAEPLVGSSVNGVTITGIDIETN